MVFKIHYEHADGVEDAFVVSGDTLEEIKKAADKGIEKRGGINPWSEELS